VCEVIHHLSHGQTVNICQCLTNLLFVDVFVGIKAIKADNQTVALLAPVCQLGNKVLPEFGSWACEIALLGDKIPAVLLIRYAAIWIFIVAGVIAARHPCLNSLTFQRHH
jgi:hypothetical protein